MVSLDVWMEFWRLVTLLLLSRRAARLASNRPDGTLRSAPRVLPWNCHQSEKKCQLGACTHPLRRESGTSAGDVARGGRAWTRGFVFAANDSSGARRQWHAAPVVPAMPRKERQAKNAAFAIAQELDSEMTDEQRERMQKSGMGVGMGGINSGEEKLFGMRLYEPAPSCAPSRRGAPCRAWRGRARCGGDHLCACCLSRHAAPD